VVHVRVRVDPREDRSWLQAAPRVPTDNAHAHDAVGPERDSAENWSEAVKRLKPRVLQRLLDTHRCGPPGAPKRAPAGRRARAARRWGSAAGTHHFAKPGGARAQARAGTHLLPHQL